VDLSKILASSSLARPKSQQIINPQLANVGAKPPWGEEVCHLPWQLYDRKLEAVFIATEGVALPVNAGFYEKIVICLKFFMVACFYLRKQLD